MNYFTLNQNPINLNRPYEYAVQHTHVQNHSDDFAYIISLPDGRQVAADHQGKAVLDSAGRYQQITGPDQMSHAERMDTLQTIRSSPQHGASQAPSAEETAAIREHLAARYGAKISATESEANPYK
jgi:hypothetical protein